MSKTTEIRPGKRFRSLAVTLTFAFLALSISILLISTSLELFFSYRTQREFIRNQQQLVAQNAARTVSEFVEEKFRVLDQAADLNNLATLADRRDLVMNKLIGRDPALRQLILIDAIGREQHKVTYLSSLTVDPLNGLREPILASVLKGERYISTVYIDEGTSEPLILIAIPARDIFREPKGAFIAEVNLKFLWDLVGGIQVGESGVAYVVDREGNLIAFRDISRVLSRENLMRVPDVRKYVERSHEVNDEFELSAKGILGTPVVASYIALGIPDWAVIVELPIREAYASTLQVLLSSLFIIVVSAMLALICGVYLSRRITEPIKRLTDIADRLATGLLGERAVVSSSDEIGHLALSINSMATKLQELYSSMEEKVKEKTAAFASQVSEVEKSKSAILNLLEDIDAEKKKAEETVVARTKELREEKAQLLASINGLSFGFVLASPDGHILLKNPALKSILEYAHEPDSMYDIAALLTEADQKHEVDVMEASRKAMAQKAAVEFRDLSFGKKFLRALCLPVVEGANTIGSIFLVEDVTEAKMLERTRDEFFAVASHELRTPLTAIRGNADMILQMYSDKIVDTDMREMLVDINASSVRLIEVVNDFLEASRLEQRRIEYAIVSFDVREIVAKVARNLHELVCKKGLMLTVLPPPENLRNVFADKDRTEQILVNLVSNATKFTREGGVTIEISQLDAALKISVTDTGLGISEHNQTRLFRKFQQAGEDMLARDVTQSSGLGLYISRLLVEGMGGTINLERSELGKGSTFSFTLPIAT